MASKLGLTWKSTGGMSGTASVCHTQPPCLPLQPLNTLCVHLRRPPRVRLQVRQLASAAALDGTVDAAAVKFVRHQKTTLLELQRRAAEKAQQIMEKQVGGWGEERKREHKHSCQKNTLTRRRALRRRPSAAAAPSAPALTARPAAARPAWPSCPACSWRC